ncbi:MAG: hypothetical protein LBV26_02455 [Bacteroidales bacterium]|jgi:hypothetical protein|nr:hypothetical protein [Bacteroidales bacterium]
MLLEASLNTVFHKLKENIRKDIGRKNLNRALKSLSFLCVLKHRCFTEFYDREVEELIGTLSSLIFPTPSDNNNTEASRVVMIDSLAWDNHGLTQQYLRAFMSMDMNILYVIIEGRYKSTQILKELEEYGKARIYTFEAKQNITEQLTDLYQTVVAFNAASIFTHSLSVIDCILLKALPVPAKYRINFGDHVYWNGSSCTDYIIEFRNWGATLSCRYRDVAKEKIIIQPFYPIEDSNAPFCGLPAVDENRVVIFSGGASYKIKNREQTFFRLLLRLFDENPQATVFFACRDDDRLLKKFIDDNKLHQRFFLIGYRSDLKAVLERTDIYLDTYPTGGGLMVLYAAVNGLPVLSLKTDNTLDCIEYDDNGIRYCSEYKNIDDLCREANMLIQNENHRKLIGSVLKNKTLTETRFNHSVAKIISGQTTGNTFSEITYNYEALRKNYQKQFFNRAAYEMAAGFLYALYSYKYLIKFPYPIVYYGTVLKIFSKLTSIISKAKQ